jgi:pimeloyl-ACP methyl ester carboxylesterase
MADFAADARVAAESLSRDRRFSRVVFVGHSEGASLALMAARDGAPVTDVVHVSGLGRGTGEVLREQLSRQFDSATLVRYDTAMKRYLADEPAAVPSGLEMLFVPVNRTYMRSMMAFDPSAAIRAVRQPVLIVQGATDLQASLADAERLHAARPDAKLVVIPEVNHVLKHDTNTTIAAQMATTYKDPTLPIAPAVVAAIADWILRPRP